MVHTSETTISRADMSRRLIGLVLLISTIAFQSYADEPEVAANPTAENADELVGDKGKAAVLWAVSSGNLRELKSLRAVLDQEVIPELSRTALNNHNIEVIEYLLEQGKIQISDLPLAIVRGDVEDVKRTLTRIAENPMTIDGQVYDEVNLGNMIYASHSPLMLAIRRGHTEIARLLITAGANVHESTMDAGYRHQSILNVAIVRGHVEIARLMIRGGAVVNVDDEVWLSVDQRNPVSPLLSKEYATLTPAERMKRQKESGKIKMHGHDYDRHLESPLFTAIGYGDSKMVAMLLESGANPNVFTEDGTRPLNVAVSKGNPEIVRLLIKHEAEVNAVTKKDNRTALWWCDNLYRHRDIANILREAGAK